MILADRVAGAVLTPGGRRRSIELLLTSLAVRSIGVLLTVRAVAAMTSQLVQFLVEVAHVRQTATAARYTTPHHSTTYWRFSAAVASFVARTKLLNVEPG